MAFQIVDPFFYTSPEIKDGENSKLEDKIGLILLKILQNAKRQLERDIDKKAEAIRRHKEWIREQKLQKKREEEQKRIDSLELQVANWKKSREIREYLKAIEEHTVKKHGGYDNSSDLGQWLRWAYSYVDRIDPFNKM